MQGLHHPPNGNGISGPGITQRIQQVRAPWRTLPQPGRQRLGEGRLRRQLREHRVNAASALWSHPQDAVDLPQRLREIALFQIALGQPRTSLQVARRALFGDQVQPPGIVLATFAVRGGG